MYRQKHLPAYGIEPFYAIVSALLTLTACLLNHFAQIPGLCFRSTDIILKIVAAFCFLIAALLWSNALFVQKMNRYIRKNELVTTEAYAWVRNPIYSDIMFIVWASLVWIGNL